MKKRCVSLDVMRCIAFLGVILYHFRVELGNFQLYIISDRMNRLLQSLDVSGLAVCLFFMISGAGAVLSDKDEFSVKVYFKKKFTRILVPFYIVYILYFGYLFLRDRVLPLGTAPGRPLWTAILTPLGLDSYVKTLRFTDTFSLGIGEWFLGVLVILYALWPLIRIGIRKMPYITMGIAELIYLLFLLILPPDYMIFVSVGLKLSNFVLGAFLIKELQKKDFRSLLLFIPFVLILLWALLLDFPVRSNALVIQEVKRTLISGVIFTACYLLEPLFSRMKLLCKAALSFSAISYEIYLVHHIIISEVFNRFIGRTLIKPEIAALFFYLMILILFGANMLRKLTDFVCTRSTKNGK